MAEITPSRIEPLDGGDGNGKQESMKAALVIGIERQHMDQSPALGIEQEHLVSLTVVGRIMLNGSKVSPIASITHIPTASGMPRS